MERRGASEVIAIDVDDPTHVDLPGRFAMSRWKSLAAIRGEAKGALRACGGRAFLARTALAVLGLRPRSATHGTFDVLFCGSLLVHLREPVRALSACPGLPRRAAALEPWTRASISCGERTLCPARAGADAMVGAPNTAGLKAMLRLAGFDVVSTSRHLLTPNGADSTSRIPPRGPLLLRERLDEDAPRRHAGAARDGRIGPRLRPLRRGGARAVRDRRSLPPSETHLQQFAASSSAWYMSRPERAPCKKPGTRL
jgi:hypothetical protein